MACGGFHRGTPSVIPHEEKDGENLMGDGLLCAAKNG